MKIALCQLNPLVGDLEGNASIIEKVLEDTAPSKPDLIIFSEMFIQGYPPRDLLEKRWFIRDCYSILDRIVHFSRNYPNTGIVTGTVLESPISPGKGLLNCAVLIHNGKILFTQAKSLLPTYDVFDESRYFDSADEISTYCFKGENLGICICEDAWNDSGLFQPKLYKRNPVAELADKKASVIINISASPFYIGKEELRSSVMKKHASTHKIPFIFLNQVGGNDELIFDGNSMFFDNAGDLCKKLAAFNEHVEIIDTENTCKSSALPRLDTIKSVHNALTLGLRDYVRKCGFSKVLIGLSGGIDSAVTCALAVNALGAGNVWGIALPSRYSSEGSIKDAEELANNLGIEFSTIGIEEIFTSFLKALDPFFAGTNPGLAEENLQARIRGTLLMALSNKFGHMLLATGNKSEASVGYSTLYGDMNGGLSVISDLPKDMVCKLANQINCDGEVIPQSTISKAPSAELRPDQKDEDSLPPYPLLDSILHKLIEDGMATREIAEQGVDQDTVSWIAKAVSKNEYKRRQAPPGLKITPKAFGSGRRFPIASNYKW
ncbi:NAD+ synthase [Chitinispirillales bacterium ANBcel5]|uniref:NAD+ synthase n=1 Tax=Cellulosispirillum alkaliphilum TaxID=3039283 RepID=UPI002A54A1F4|nr:NAD+ synthase [Chitinispirillales bacterium ANBcel5]